MFYYTYLNFNYFTFAGMLMYTRNFLFSLWNCWKSRSKSPGYGLMHRPLSKQGWLTLKNLNLLAPRRGQRGRNHLRRPHDRPINVLIRVERQKLHSCVISNTFRYQSTPPNTEYIFSQLAVNIMWYCRLKIAISL